MELLYKETLAELKEINSNLKQIANIGRGMEAGINQINETLVTFFFK